MDLGEGVIVESGAIVEAASVGPFSVIGVGAKVGKGAVIGANCTICAKVEIGEGEVVEDETAVGGNGREQRRKERGMREEGRRERVENLAMAVRGVWSLK